MSYRDWKRKKINSIGKISTKTNSRQELLTLSCIVWTLSTNWKTSSCTSHFTKPTVTAPAATLISNLLIHTNRTGVMALLQVILVLFTIIINSTNLPICSKGIQHMTISILKTSCFLSLLTRLLKIYKKTTCIDRVLKTESAECNFNYNYLTYELEKTKEV